MHAGLGARDYTEGDGDGRRGNIDHERPCEDSVRNKPSGTQQTEIGRIAQQQSGFFVCLILIPYRSAAKEVIEMARRSQGIECGSWADLAAICSSWRR